MNDKPLEKPLEFSYDGRDDVLTIEGVKYSGVLFRAFAGVGLNIGEPFIIIEREDGLVTFKLLVCKECPRLGDKNRA